MYCKAFSFAAGISSLGAQFAKLQTGLRHLNFSKTSLSPKGKTKQIVSGMKKNVGSLPTVAQRMNLCVWLKAPGSLCKAAL